MVQVVRVFKIPTEPTVKSPVKEKMMVIEPIEEKMMVIKPIEEKMVIEPIEEKMVIEPIEDLPPTEEPVMESATELIPNLSWSMADIRKYCKTHNIISKGRKAQILARITAHCT